MVETGQRGEEQGCGEMRGLCWAPRDGTAGLEVEHLDDNDAYREVGDSANKPQSCMGRGGRDLGLCCSLLYSSAWNSAGRRVHSMNIQE